MDVIEIKKEVKLPQDDGSVVVLEARDRIRVIETEDLPESDDENKDDKVDEIAQNLLKHNQKKNPPKINK